MRAVLYLIGGVLGAYLVVRAIVEPFVISFGDPASYAKDWGGPSLFGVLAVHCGPGLVVLGIVFGLLVRRFGSSRRQLVRHRGFPLTSRAAQVEWRDRRGPTAIP